jgi:hypothetical protein
MTLELASWGQFFTTLFHRSNGSLYANPDTHAHVGMGSKLVNGHHMSMCMYIDVLFSLFCFFQRARHLATAVFTPTCFCCGFLAIPWLAPMTSHQTNAIQQNTMPWRREVDSSDP